MANKGINMKDRNYVLYNRKTNEETMRKHYERTSKDILINVLISSREEVIKLQKQYEKKLNENTELTKEAVDMYNIIEGNIKIKKKW